MVPSACVATPPVQLPRSTVAAEAGATTTSVLTATNEQHYEQAFHQRLLSSSRSRNATWLRRRLPEADAPPCVHRSSAP